MGSGESFLVVDIDSGVTKAVLIEGDEAGYHVSGAAEAPTTIDPPELDVMVGVREAVERLGKGLGLSLWGAEGPSKPRLFLCSSGASGGLHMMVAGVMSMISTESAQRAALGAGALLMDIFSKDDRRPEYVKVARMRALRPDMFLLAGGTDGGARSQVIEMAELIRAAGVRPRFGSDYKLPVIYAGNVEIRDEVTGIVSEERYATRLVENVRPVIERENLGPAREGIYDAYMEHVIVHSPGFDKLVGLVDEPIIPTQAAIGRLLYAYAMMRGVNLVGVDVGGETTNVYSVLNSVFNRSLNADIGMTYGVCNIMKQAGVENILRWLPVEMSEREARNIIANMMILQSRPTSRDEALVKMSAAREAIRLGVESHKKIASRLKGVHIKRDVSDLFAQAMDSTNLVMMRVQAVIGRGETFREGTSRGEAALLLMDSLEPEGVTELSIDGSSVMPHLGMLYERNPDAALEVLSKQCLLRLGTCIAPTGRGHLEDVAMRVRLIRGDGSVVNEEVPFGDLKTITLGAGEAAKVRVEPARGLDVGRGRGRALESGVTGGEVGVILDCRGRPLQVPRNREVLTRWSRSIASTTESMETR